MTRSSTPERVPAVVWRIAGVAMFGPLMTNLDATVVNVSLDAMGRALGTSLDTIQWVTSAYLLALALALPLSGWLVERYGGRRVYLGCFAAFTLASLLCAASPSVDWLIAARVLQGLTGGLLAPLAQMTIARAAGRQVGRVMGVSVVPVLIGPIFGPLLGGAIQQLADWRWLFLFNLPVGLLAILLAAWVLPRDDNQRRRRPFDAFGLLLLSPALVLLLLGLDALRDSGTGMWLLVVAGGLLMAFTRHGWHRGETALLDLRLFTRRTFAVSAAAQFAANGVMLGGQVLLPLVLLAQGARPVEVGALLAATGIGAILAYPSAGWLTERFGPRAVLIAGAGLTLAGTLPFLLPGPGRLTIPATAAVLFLRGLGLGGLTLPSITAAYATLPRAALPNATTTLNIAQRLGGPVATTGLTLAAHGAVGTFPLALGLLCLMTLVVAGCGIFLPGLASASTNQTRSATA